MVRTVKSDLEEQRFATSGGIGSRTGSRVVFWRGRKTGGLAAKERCKVAAYH